VRSAVANSDAVESTKSESKCKSTNTEQSPSVAKIQHSQSNRA